MWSRLQQLLLKLGHRARPYRSGLAGRPGNRPGTGIAGEAAVWRFQSLFNNFRRILDQNNAALVQMEAMERALGGDYIFDHAFLENSVRQLCTLVHHVAYNLNALTRNAHVALYERFQEISGTLHQILAGGPSGSSTRLCIPLAEIGWELESEVGLAAVCLAELRRQARIPVMDGYVITAPACRALLTHGRPQVLDGSEPHGAAAVSRQMAKATEELVSATGAAQLSVALLALDPQQGPWLPAARPAGPQQVPDTVLGLLRQAAAPENGAPGWAALVQEGLAAPLYGEINTRALAERRLDLLRVIARRTDAPGAVDRYLLRRAQPFDLLRSEVAPRSMDGALPDGLRPIQRGASGWRRGSALLTLPSAQALAEAGVIVERLFGSPCVVHWGAAAQGRLAVRGISPREMPAPAETGTNLAAILAHSRVLCRGGQTVQSGVAAGNVVHVTEAIDPQRFPAGAIAVALSASPRLASVLPHAAALLTEVGTAAGHLATVARELRVPAIFGLPGALRALPEGASVTVDAAETVVYEGVIDELLRYDAASSELYPTDPEYRLLRRLLRFIQPLHLVDPAAPDFTPQGCRSLHDILHYCHEQAVHELAHLHERHPGLAGVQAQRIETGVPLEIGVLDIGEALSHHEAAPGIGGIRCQPLAAFLEGLRLPEAWNDAPADLGLGAVISGLPRTLAALEAPAEAVAGNLAIAARDYLNLSLRLGYHFSVIDAYLGPDPQRSYVYFRFAGGFADDQRRYRRARFIRDVLAALDFNVSRQGDLVVGRLKLVPLESLRAALVTLGALTAYTRQRDIDLNDDADQQALFARFAQAFLPAALVSTKESLPSCSTD